MLEFNYAAARRQMIEQQVRTWEVLDPAVVAVMGRIPRERYAPDRYRNLAYADSAIPLGHGEIMLAPKLQGRLLQALAVHPGDQALEIGTGTGYLAACLAALGAQVRSIEIREDFVAIAREHLAAARLASIELVQEDGHTLPTEGPRYDVILVTGSLPVADTTFPHRLALSGRLVWIVGEAPTMRVERVIRVDTNEWRTEALLETVVPPLIGVEPPRHFEF